MKRVIYVEPEIENFEIINLFNKYNPDSNFVNPHICLVYPFKSDLDSIRINEIIQSVLGEMKEFEIELNGISISYEEKNNFVFLNVDDKEQKLSKLSKKLYSKLNGVAALKGEFTPHITLGKNSSIEEIDKIRLDIEKSLNLIYTCKIKSIKSSIMVLDEKSNIYLQPECIFHLKSTSKKL